jgi:tetratricopeptide (TPR) repeat protein
MKKIIVGLFLLFFFSVSLSAQDINTMLKEADRLETSLKEKAAYDKYVEVLRIQPTNITALWKCSELCSRIGKRQPTKADQINYYKAAQSFAEQALKADPNSAEANYVMSVAMGRQALILSGKEKVKAAKQIKAYVDNSIRINPNFAKSWHVLGKWHYEVSNLSGIERAAAKVLFGGIPKASFAESVAAYEKAKSLDVYFMLNYLELGKAYKKNDQLAQALEVLGKIASLPIRTEDDTQIKAEAKALLADWQ